MDLTDRAPTSPDVSATAPGDGTWSPTVRGYRTYARSVRLGHGEELWAAASSAVLEWGVKTRSGFRVEPADGALTAREAARYRLEARVGPVVVREPVRVVAVVDEPDRRGFAYGTLAGHPVSGEEAFVVHRTPDDDVWFTLRSVTRSSRGAWRLAYPALVLAQRRYRRRYLRALLPAR